MQQEPTILEILEQVSDAWISGQRPNTAQVTFIGNRLAAEKAKMQAAPAAAPAAEPAPEA